MKILALASCLLMIASLGLVGCAGSGPGGTPYIIRPDRKLVATIDADLAATHNMAINVLEEELLYEINDAAKDAREGIIKARTARNHTVRVETYKLDETATNVFIFVGPFGDTHAQVDIFERLEARLN